ncbi:hypothetical protein CTAYLR_007544 [Chrysophaeum taylorii]|uniref:Probable cytosolic iron-sulfur protein assembly protein CIAO1 homolog n=1 Tax=Chrysophaeum taylorii TaxID=2483200 RepID=A0AAD7XJC1_9STRA|nr:hypothetical protein CTAYLR_007544 [Chrysophaeum taylorii]
MPSSAVPVGRLAHEDRVWHVTWSRDGLLLATCSERCVRIWQQQQQGGAWVEACQLEEVHDRTVRCVSWSPCGRFLAAVSFDATCTVWRTIDFDLVATLEGHENEVKACAWNANATLIATCGRDKTVWLWEVEDFELLTVLHGHSADVKALAFEPETDALASASYDATIKIWEDDGDDWACRGTLEGHTSTVWDCRFLDSNRLASCGADRRVLVWHNNDGAWTVVSRFDDLHARPIYSIDATSAGLVATAGGDNALAFLDAETRLLLFRVPRAHDGDLNCVRFHPKDPTLLATASDDATVLVWRLVS